MRIDAPESTQVDLAPGDLLSGAQRTALWRLQSGALCLQEAGADGNPVLVGVALPGDLIGVERLWGGPANTGLRALIQSRLVLVARDPTPSQSQLLAQALMESRRQCSDNMRLRTGPVAERVKCLLLMLSDPGRTGGRGPDIELPCALPSLRDMALVVDSAPETVSRVLGSLRRLDVLHDRKPKSVCFNRLDLRELKAMPGMTSSHVSAQREETPSPA